MQDKKIQKKNKLNKKNKKKDGSEMFLFNK
jgi:hypothetical protein